MSTAGHQERSNYFYDCEHQSTIDSKKEKLRK